MDGNQLNSNQPASSQRVLQRALDDFYEEDFSQERLNPVNKDVDNPE